MAGRDIGKSLGTLAKKIIPEGTGLEDCIKLVTAWMNKEIAIAQANENTAKEEAARDRGECLLAVLDSAPGINDREDLLFALQRLFADKGALVLLSTIHRSKGLEWDLVLHIDYWRIPSQQALTNPLALEQELNITYVCETRARRVFIEATAQELKRN